MNKDIFEGKWTEYKGKIKEKWGKLTDNDITEINGKREALLGKIQTRYGYAKERAEKELNEFEKNGCGCSKEKAHSSHSGEKGHFHNKH